MQVHKPTNSLMKVVCAAASLLCSPHAQADDVLFGPTQTQAVLDAARDKTAVCKPSPAGGHFVAVYDAHLGWPIMETLDLSPDNRWMRFTNSKVSDNVIEWTSRSAWFDTSQHTAQGLAVGADHIWGKTFINTDEVMRKGCDDPSIAHIFTPSGPPAQPYNPQPILPPLVQKAPPTSCKNLLDEAKSLLGGKPLSVNPATPQEREALDKYLQYRDCNTPRFSPQ